MGNPAQLRSRHLAPGDKLGKYDLIRQIAVGGMAELYLARTVGIEGFEKLVVIKRILPQYVANASFVEMFLNEARLAATLHHPNIAQVYDIGLDAGDYFFAMEYVHGEDLQRIATASNEQGVPISMDAALTLAAGLCAGSHYAHDKVGPDGKPLQIVHRDISPSNVIISYDGGVKLVDFGIARAATRHTTNSGLKGKVSYMSPEQCRNRTTLDRRSDIYSIGVVLYELTTGRLPFDGDNEYGVLHQIVNDPAPPPSQLVPDYPPQLEAIVMRAMAKDPAHRYATALELQGQLEDFAHESRLRVSPLVLARLMETLFPERLEEWAHAKTQGAFFVEQHVVRTLIESGKTPDPEAQQLQMAVAAEEARRAAATQSDEETTAVTATVREESVTATLGDPTTGDRIPVAVPGSGYPTPSEPMPVLAPAPSPPARAITPFPRALTPPPAPFVPGMPGAVPILPASAGTLYSNPAPSHVAPLQVAPLPIAPPHVAQKPEVTERVHAHARAQSPTKLVRAARRTSPWLALVAVVVIAGGVGAVIALRASSSSSDQPASAAASASDQAAPAPPPAATAPPAVTPPAAPPPPVEPAPAPAPPAESVETAAPALAAPAKAIATKPEPAKPAVVHKAVHAPPRAKPKSAPSEPSKEQTPWNDDSPFMPVRTGKH